MGLTWKGAGVWDRYTKECYLYEDQRERILISVKFHPILVIFMNNYDIYVRSRTKLGGSHSTYRKLNETFLLLHVWLETLCLLLFKSIGVATLFR